MPPKVAAFMAKSPPPSCAVWPENWPALKLFLALDTQWRFGPRGPTGLDYAVIPTVMDLENIAPEARAALFEDLRTMESGALEALAEKG